MGETPDVAILIPMLGRPSAVGPLVESIREADRERRCRTVFLVSRDDHDVHEAIRQAVARHDDITMATLTDPPGPGDYARKINHGCDITDEPLIFTGASDIRFTPGWLQAALAADPMGRYGVIGTNDMGNALVKSGRHSTHSLVRRSHLEHAVIDAPGKLYCEEYEHNYVDMELVDYAVVRRLFVSARKSVVEHFHPDWRKAETDAIYEKGKAGFKRDQKLFIDRKALWRGANLQEARRLARARVSQRIR